MMVCDWRGFFSRSRTFILAVSQLSQNFQTITGLYDVSKTIIGHWVVWYTRDL
jgi:hypothetical protein